MSTNKLETKQLLHETGTKITRANHAMYAKHLKEHSAVVVKKEFRLRKAFNFFKNIY